MKAEEFKKLAWMVLRSRGHRVDEDTIVYDDDEIRLYWRNYKTGGTMFDVMSKYRMGKNGNMEPFYLETSGSMNFFIVDHWAMRAIIHMEKITVLERLAAEG